MIYLVIEDEVLASKDLTPAEKLVYMVRKNYPNESFSKLSEITGLSLNTIKSGLSKIDSERVSKFDSMLQNATEVSKFDSDEFSQLLEENGIIISSVPKDNGNEAMKYLAKMSFMLDKDLENIGINKDNILDYL